MNCSWKIKYWKHNDLTLFGGSVRTFHLPVECSQWRWKVFSAFSLLDDFSCNFLLLCS